MDNESSGCTGCAPGSYSPDTGASMCLGCEAGLFSSGIGAGYCINCTNGTFSLEGASICSLCSPGEFSMDYGVSSCQECSPGQYTSDSGGSYCVECEKGRFQEGFRGTTCLACSPGTFSEVPASTICTNCIPGTYSQTDGASGCLSCGAGTFATKIGMTTAEECGPCEAGTFSTGFGTVCEACSPGTYSWKGAMGCLVCPANSDSAERAALRDCVCRAGYFYNWTGDFELVCLGCPAGQFSAQVGASRCQDCSVGEYSLGGQVIACSMCRPGTYLDSTGASGCTNCSDGMFSGYDGATQCDSCETGLYAGMGLSACLACGPGTFGGRRGMSACEDCPTGTYSTGWQASVCTLCPTGTFQEKTGWTGCDLCLAGTFSDMLGIRNASECQDCPSGYYSTTEGLTDVKECLRCPVGRMSDAGATSCGDCRPGEFPNEVYGACATCPLHSVAEVNASRPEECRCIAGYRLAYNAKGFGGTESYAGLVKTHTFQYTDSEFHLLTQAIVEAYCAGEQVLPPTVLQAGVFPIGGESACGLPRVVQYEVDVQFDGRETQTYVQCIPCAAGTFSVGVVGEKCQQCPSKRYQDMTGQTYCKRCPSGRPENEGMAVCEPCPGTMVAQNEECKPCPAGTFYSRLLGDPACLRCPNNMWSESGADNCLLCPPSSAGPGGTGLDGCKCGIGLEMQVLQNNPYCVACKPGKYSNQGVCVPCWNGTYNTQVGSGVCYQCPSYAVAWGGATACTTCVMGKVPSRDGGSCVACPAGYYCGVGVLYACPLGSYSIKTGLTLKSQCPACPRNYFCRSAITIEACPAHTWSPLGSITRHYCVCDSGYKCLYSFSTVGNVNLALTPEEFAAQKDQIVLALAKAAGVNPSSIKIVGVTQQQQQVSP